MQLRRISQVTCFFCCVIVFRLASLIRDKRPLSPSFTMLPLLLFLLPLAHSATYSDDFARNTMLPLASAAYSSHPENCLAKIFGDGQLKRQVNVKCDTFSSDICSGYTGIINSKKAIVVSFRGTQGFLQLVEEANKSVFGSQIAWIAGGKVSKYFGDAFTFLWNKGIKDDLLTLRNANPSYEIWVTGHSLGGSIASLAASYIVASGVVPASQVKLVTFGQPRTGDKNFASAHDNQMSYSFRVTHWRDMVPHVPNENFEGYYHHKFEAFYKEKMQPNQVTVCQNDEDKNCSDGLDITASIDDHLHYFDKDVSGYGESGCH